jgi:hypothetical protein
MCSKKYVCPSKKKEMEKNSGTKMRNIEDRNHGESMNKMSKEKDACDIIYSEKEFPELGSSFVSAGAKSEKKKSESTLPQGKTFLEVFEKSNSIAEPRPAAQSPESSAYADGPFSDSEEDNQKVVSTPKTIKYSLKTFLRKNEKKFIYDKERRYDKSGWMINDDWVFWFEHFHPNQIGSF